MQLRACLLELLQRQPNCFPAVLLLRRTPVHLRTHLFEDFGVLLAEDQAEVKKLAGVHVPAVEADPAVLLFLA